MQKLDKLILTSFIGPLILTFLVVIFILLTKQMFYYFDDIIGKDLGWNVLIKFLTYFAVLMFPAALPLSILLASLITFGNLAEHFELNAIKASGISLTRVLRPIFFFVSALTLLAFYINNEVVPSTALEAYTLLYDIKKKKPALDIREGEFYTGLPDISIKVNRKFAQDESALKDIILYDHRANNGNTEVILADSGRMTTILSERYLRLELFNGYQYAENGDVETSTTIDRPGESSGTHLTKRTFLKAEIITDLSSFAISASDKKIFESNRQMRNMHQLSINIDSLNKTISLQQLHVTYPLSKFGFFDKRNSTRQYDQTRLQKVDEVYNEPPNLQIIQRATDAARLEKDRLMNTAAAVEHFETELAMYKIQWHRIPATAVACIVMFLIGAPLGAIIKRGGIGIPFLISVFFFILYTLLGMQGEKLAKQFFISAMAGAWSANALLFVIGLIFLKIARDDRHVF